MFPSALPFCSSLTVTVCCAAPEMRDKIAFIILFHAATMEKGTVAACSLPFQNVLHPVMTITSASQTS